MDDGKIITFNNNEYRIKKVLYKSKGSLKQKISEELSDNIEIRRTYYIVERDDKKYWVKEYTDPDLGYSIEYEFNETKKFHELKVQIGHSNISAIRAIFLNKNRILMKYYKDYVKLSEAKGFNRKFLRKLFELWIEKSKVHSYDMSANNTLIKGKNKNLKVRLLDFEYSLGRDFDKWNLFLRSLSRNVIFRFIKKSKYYIKTFKRKNKNK